MPNEKPPPPRGRHSSRGQFLGSLDPPRCYIRCEEEFCSHLFITFEVRIPMDVLFSAWVGFTLTRGDHWIAPVVMRADWPLGRFVLTRQVIRVSFLLSSSAVEIPLNSITEVRSTWSGMQLRYVVEGEPHALDVSPPWIWTRFQNALRQHDLIVPYQPAAPARAN